MLLLLMVPTAVWALDHDNLDPNRPIAIEDAYVVPKGEIGVEGGVMFNDHKQGKSRFVFQPQLIIGAFDNTQLELSSDVQTDPTSVVGDDKSGNLTVGALYNLNTETLSLPALAVRAQLGLPTGVNAKGVDTALTGVMTRSYRTMADAPQYRLYVSRISTRHGAVGSVPGSGGGQLSIRLSDQLSRYYHRKCLHPPV